MKKVVALLLSMISLSVGAAEREFDVEVIIFKRTVEPESLNESWPEKLPAIDMTNVGTFNDQQYRTDKGVIMLPYENYELLEQKESLDKHAGFDVLLHTAWRQGDQPKSRAPVFHIRAGKDFSESFNPDGSEKVEIVSDGLNDDIIIEETDIAKPLYELDGKFQVYVQHYLFLETDLDLKSPWTREVLIETTEPEIEQPFEEVVVTEETSAEETIQEDSAFTVPEAEPINETVQFGNLEAVEPTYKVEAFLKNYRMSQKRRMRSGEIHYLDHPLMGIVIQVRRAPTEES